MESKRTNNRRKKTRVFEVCGPKKMQGVWELKIEIHNTQGTKTF
jgi:hypothetical protein